MTKDSKTPRSQQGVIAEAWQKMSADMDRFLPQKLQGGRGKLKFSLLLLVVELLVLGAVGKFVYDWIQG